MSPPRLLLVGDSHLARLGDAIPQLGPTVTNRAVGGAFTTDLPGQVEGLDLTSYDVALVSAGTNDAAPWKRVPVAEAVAALTAFVAALPCPVVLVAPPGVDERRLVRERDRTNDVVDRHGAAAAEVVTASGGQVVYTRRVLAPLGQRAFRADGVHLTPAAYALLLPAAAEAVETARRPATTR